MESEHESALKEIAEEIGLSVDFIDGFKTEVSYVFNRGGRKIKKHVVYFLSKFSNQVSTVQESELSSIHLMDFDTAVRTFQYGGAKTI